MLRRSLVALLKTPPWAYGWCRTRWSCATLDVAGHTGDDDDLGLKPRRWLHAADWVWKRPKRVAKDNDPRRVERLARIRVTCEPLKRSEAMVFADALDIHLLPTVGYAWMPKGTHMTVMTPGTNEKHLSGRGP